MDLPFQTYSQRTKQRKIRQTVDNHLLDLNSSPAVDEHGKSYQTSELENFGNDVSQGDCSVDVVEIAEARQDVSSISSLSAEEYPSSDTASGEAVGTNDTQQCLREDIGSWAAQHNISHSALSDLLGALRQNEVDVPSDPRAVMGTPRSVDVK